MHKIYILFFSNKQLLNSAKTCFIPYNTVIPPICINQDQSSVPLATTQLKIIVVA